MPVHIYLHSLSGEMVIYSFTRFQFFKFPSFYNGKRLSFSIIVLISQGSLKELGKKYIVDDE